MASTLRMLCDRPHTRDIDFNTARFVVAVYAGLMIDGKKLERGDEVPHGALSPQALQQEYDMFAPHPIELLEYALKDPDLCQACAERGMDVNGVLADLDAQFKSGASGQSLNEPTNKNDLSKLNRKELVALCDRSGVPTHGTAQQLRERLAALLD